MRKGDLFLIGLDLNKSADILHAAYDDASGITAKFNKNILHRINSELGADFDLEQFEHHVVYDEKQMRVGMYLKSMQRQTVSIPKSGIRTVFEKDEMIHTENSFKYTPDSIKLMLSQAGLKIENMWCDDDKMCIISSFSNTVRMPDFGIDTVCLCIDFRYIPTRICFSSYTT